MPSMKRARNKLLALLRHLNEALPMDGNDFVAESIKDTPSGEKRWMAIGSAAASVLILAVLLVSYFALGLSALVTALVLLAFLAIGLTIVWLLPAR